MAVLSEEELNRELSRHRERKRLEGRIPKKSSREGELLVGEERRKVARERMLPVMLLLRQGLYRFVGLVTAVPYVHEWALRGELETINDINAFYYEKVGEIEASRKREEGEVGE